eukprot:14243302-Ditylum_brightwellii.AAC.2
MGEQGGANQSNNFKLGKEMTLLKTYPVELEALEKYMGKMKLKHSYRLIRWIDTYANKRTL